MKTIESTAERSLVEFTKAELQILNAALNEVCNGIEVFEFETRMGTDIENVSNFLKEIGTLLDMMDFKSN